MSVTERPNGITVTRPGLLVRLLELLAEDRSDDPADRHGKFNLVAAAGHGIETTGVFVFAVEADEEHALEEHEAARARIAAEFPDTEIVERLHEHLEHREGALRDWLATLSDKGYLIDEIVVGVADCGPQDAEGSTLTVPVQASVIDARTRR
jgi:hypothetical protein